MKKELYYLKAINLRCAFEDAQMYPEFKYTDHERYSAPQIVIDEFNSLNIDDKYLFEYRIGIDYGDCEYCTEYKTCTIQVNWCEDIIPNKFVKLNKLDEWLVENGCSVGETVILYNSDDED